MRTDSTLCPTRRSTPRGQIRRMYGDEYLPDQPRTYRNKVKNAQEAHEAIRPAGDRMRTADDLGRELQGDDERRLYDLIWKRTVASQMADARVSAGSRCDWWRRHGRRGGGVPGVGAHDRVSRLSPGLCRGCRRSRRRAQDREAILPPLAEGDEVECRELHPSSTRPSRRRATPKRAW